MPSSPPTPVYTSPHYTLWPDRVIEGPFSAHAPSRSEILSTYPNPDRAGGEATPLHWTLRENLDRYPQATSDFPLLDALYNLSLEELKQDTRSDGAFDAGAKWQGVWTRDVSYSILLSLAAIEPDAAKASLLQKVHRDRVVQDTGTGGSWPVSTDRVCWALAAREIYLVTGDRNWLQQSFTIIQNTIRDDEAVVLDPATGLARGESSFLDWREQTYPRWMEPADIYSSKSLGTNAVFYRTYRILAAMSGELGLPALEWDAKANRIRSAINDRMWIEDRQLYGQYLYGRVRQTLSPRSDALGQALCVLFEVAEPSRQDDILRAQPLMPFGIPTVYPQTPNVPPYHNRSVWPFVQAFWNLAAARRNDAVLLHGLASIYRSSALFLTNKENFVADTGSPAGTEINSDRQLWSVAGNLAMTYRVLFGMSFETDGLHLHPVVPESLGGRRTLTGFHYRNAVLSITVNGFGNSIRSMTLDGQGVPAVVPPGLRGDHAIVLEMDSRPSASQPPRLVENLTAPETPVVVASEGSLTWEAIEGAAEYQVYRNGEPFTLSAGNSFVPARRKELTQYQVAAISAEGTASFLSAPIITSGESTILPADPSGFATLEQTGSTGLWIEGTVSQPGAYSFAVRYANGSGPISTDNKCATRTLFVDGKEIGPVVMPQRGADRWDDWGLSNRQSLQLASGAHHFELRALPHDLNMNGDFGRALIQSIALTPLT